MPSRADILVIDDDPFIRDAVGDALREQGHHVDRLDRGQSALERIGRQRPVDLAIVDCKLPDISGLDLLRSIKARSPETEVILITGHASLDGALAAMAGEATSYLVKPVATAQLLATVERALTRQALVRALRDSEERYRLVAESMREALLLVDLEGGLAMLNGYGEQLTGFRADELVGRSIFSVLDRAGAALARERLEAVRAGREVAPELECRLVRKDGRRVPVQLVCTSIVRDEQVIGRLVVVRDVTERQQAQATRALLSSIVESSEDAIIGCTLEGRIVSWNPAATRLYGHAPEEALGRPVSLIVPPERRAELGDILARLGRGGQVASYEAVRLTKDGRRLDVSLTVSPIKDDAGRVIGASSTARDITARLRAERTARALAQVGRELLGTLELSRIGDRIVRAVLEVFQGRRAVLYELEPVSQRLVCVAAAGPGVPGKWVGSHLPAGVGIAWCAVAEQRVIASAALPGDGTAVEVGQAVIAVPLTARDRVLGALMVGGEPDRVYTADEQRLLTVFGDQAALALQNAQLFTETERARRIAERLAGRRFTGDDIALARAFADQAAVALENSARSEALQAALDEVRDSQHELVESERRRAVGSLTEGVTDYVRQVLQMILGKVQLVLPQLEATPNHELLASIKTTVMEAADVLKRLQVFSEVRTLPEAPPLDLNDVVRAAIEAARSLRPAGAEAGPPTEIELEAGPLPPVSGEAAALIDAITAVLANAIEALPAGGTVRVKTWAAGPSVHCAVQDGGVGMSPVSRARALEPFFTTKAGEHKGLGLSVAHGLLRRHGGALEISSAEGEGTVITLRLPARPV